MILILSSNSAWSQVVLDTGDFVEYIDNHVDNMPWSSGNDYDTMTVAEQATLGRTLDLVIAGSYSEAADSAAVLDYQLTQFLDTTTNPDATYYVLNNTSTNYWGSVAINPSFCRPLVIQSPHPGFDFRTGIQGAYVFRETESFAFCISGTHRCNNSNLSSCAGTTTVCGSSSAFRISDQPHHTNNLFQTITDSLYSQYANTYFIQLHGFAMGAGDPYVILSNGTRDTPTVDYLSSFATHLYNEDTVLTFKIGHIDTAWDELLGFTNTQGRLINESNNPCNQSASSTTGRFLHIEQEKSRLRNDQVGWEKVANALENTFACGALPVRLIEFQAYAKNTNENKVRWKTASEWDNSGFILQSSIDGQAWDSVAFIPGRIHSTTVATYVYHHLNARNDVNWYLLEDVDLYGKRTRAGIARLVTLAEKSVSCYPNPAKDVITVHGIDDSHTTFVLTSIIGKVIGTGELVDGQLDVSEVPDGMYFLIISDQVKDETFKVLVKHEP